MTTARPASKPGGGIRGKAIAVIVIILILLGLAAMTMEYAQINEGERGIIITGGEVEDIQAPGIFFRPFAPFTRVEMVNIRRQTRELTQNVASEDKQLYDLVIAVDYSRSLNNEHLKKQFAELGTDDEALATFLKGFINDAMKSASTQFTVDEALADRDGLAGKIREALTTAPEGQRSPVDQIYVTLEAVKVVDINVSEDYKKLLSDKANLQVQIETENKRKEQITAQQNNNRFQAEQEAEIALIREKGITAASLEEATRDKQIRTIQGAYWRENPELFELRKRELLVQMMQSGNVYFIDPNTNLTLLLDSMAGGLNPVVRPTVIPDDDIVIPEPTPQP